MCVQVGSRRLCLIHVSSFKSVEMQHFTPVDYMLVLLRGFTSETSFLVPALCAYP